jgi:hypothetical protein
MKLYFVYPRSHSANTTLEQMFLFKMKHGKVFEKIESCHRAIRGYNAGCWHKEEYNIYCVDIGGIKIEQIAEAE